MPKKPSATVAKPATPAREVLYPAIVVNGVTIPEEKTIINVELAKKLLGWEEETDQVKFGPDYLLIDEAGRKIRCTNNTHNRPLTEGWARTLGQDILKRNWRFNCENIIVGRTGLILSGQHRLIGLILAAQIWAGAQKDHWLPLWPEEPTIRSLIAFGCDESPDITRTHDNVKPRSLSDVLFADEQMFGSLKKEDRTRLCRMIDYAVKFLWDRTGEKNDAYAPRRTHSEALDFIQRHPRIVRAVKHIYEEDQEKAISKFISPGTASGLLYLMGASATNGDDYRSEDQSSEKKIDWKLWEKATDFWVLMSSGSPELIEVRHALAALYGEDGDGGGGTISERIAIIGKAWKEFAFGGAVTEANLRLNYVTDEDGIKHLKESITFGGIDLGTEKEEPAPAPVVTAAPAPAPASVEDPAKKEEERKAKVAEVAKKLKESRKKKAEKEAVATPE